MSAHRVGGGRAGSAHWGTSGVVSAGCSAPRGPGRQTRGSRTAVTRSTVRMRGPPRPARCYFGPSHHWYQKLSPGDGRRFPHNVDTAGTARALYPAQNTAESACGCAMWCGSLSTNRSRYTLQKDSASSPPLTRCLGDRLRWYATPGPELHTQTGRDRGR